MDDPYGRISHRLVADLHAAAALVESTPGSEVLEPLLPQAEVPPVAARSVAEGDELAAGEAAPAGPSLPVTVASPARELERTSARGLSVLAATEAAMGSDGSQWVGVAISGCVMIGPTCLGTRVHLWHDLDAAGESSHAVGQRATGEMALSIDVPVARGQWEVRPGAELGLGWIHMGRLAVRPSDDSDFDQGEVLTGAHVSAAYAFSRCWALDLGMDATVALFAHRSPFMVQGQQLPGEPAAFVVASVGVRYRSP